MAATDKREGWWPLYLWVVLKMPSLHRLPLMSPQWERERVSCYFWWGWKSQPPTWLSVTVSQGWEITVPHTAQRWSKLFTWPLLVCMRVRPQVWACVVVVVFAWCRVIVV